MNLVEESCFNLMNAIHRLNFQNKRFLKTYREQDVDELFSSIALRFIDNEISEEVFKAITRLYYEIKELDNACNN